MNTLTDLGERIIKTEKERDQLKQQGNLLREDIALLKNNQKTRDKLIDNLKEENANLRNELDQYKIAHDKLTAGLKEAVAESIKYKRERDSLIEDVEKMREEKAAIEMHLDAIKTYKPMYEKLREENNNLKQSVNDYKNTAEWYVANWQEYKALEHENRTLKSENLALRLQADEYFELWQNLDSKHKKLTEHIKDKANNNPSEHRYFRLVHFIDDLEADTHEGN